MVAVLDRGALVEYGVPRTLLATEGSVFREMFGVNGGEL